jgi:hypothetical protein
MKKETWFLIKANYYSKLISVKDDHIQSSLHSDKYLNAWKDISYMLMTFDFIISGVLLLNDNYSDFNCNHK